MDTTAKPQYDRVLHAFFDAMLVRAFVVVRAHSAIDFVAPDVFKVGRVA